MTENLREETQVLQPWEESQLGLLTEDTKIWYNTQHKKR